MNKARMTIDEFLYQSGLRINNSINDEVIASRVSNFGYTPERLAVGKDLLTSAITSCEKFDKEHGDVKRAYKERDIQKEQCNVSYLQFHTVAQVALKKDTAAQVALGLSGRRAIRIGAWISQVRGFYNNLKENEAWMNAVAQYGITMEKINEALSELKEVEEFEEIIMREKGDAQNSTVERDNKLETLHEWVADYEKIAEVALITEPQLLEKIGIVVKR